MTAQGRAVSNGGSSPCSPCSALKKRLRVAPRGSGPAPKKRAFDTARGPSLPPLSSDRAAENEQEQTMNRIDENAWVKAREEEIEKMWAEKLPPVQPAEIPEHELPY